MIVRAIPYLLVAVILAVAIMPARAAVEVGQPAPAIEAVDVNGNAFNLADHKGKVVVLEWTNKDCPFVVKHYQPGHMQNLQQQVRDMGGEWIKILSSAEGKQGFLTAEEAIAHNQEVGSNATTMILDPNGEIGKAYDAKTTPHMFVIDVDGNIAYMGAIDSDSSARSEAIEGAENYVMAAVNALKAGEPVATPSTAPYGCSVKY
jgi:peroxiredoxin